MTWLKDDKVNVERTERLSDFQVVGQCIVNAGVTELVVVMLVTTTRDGMSVGKVLCERIGVSVCPLAWCKHFLRTEVQCLPVVGTVHRAGQCGSGVPASCRATSVTLSQV